MNNIPPLPALLTNHAFSFPARPGNYLLEIQAPALPAVKIGRLGRFDLPGGWYYYVGSARGPGGLRARLGRHLKPNKRLHWHIDYLLELSPVKRVFWAETAGNIEHDWANLLRATFSGLVLCPGFGASDCRCKAHLFYFSEKISIDQFAEACRSEEVAAPAGVLSVSQGGQ